MEKKDLRIIVAVVGLLLVVSSACTSCESRSGTELFAVFLLDPVPDSVEILHSEDAPFFFDNAVWLHFRITPDDFEAVLQADGYVPVEKDEQWGGGGVILEWWKPEALGDDAESFECTDECEAERLHKRIWVNVERTEVFFSGLFLDAH